MAKKFEEQIHEEIELKEQPDSRVGSKYDNQEVLSFIVENRNQDKSFDEIAQNLRLRGYPNIVASQVSDLHAKAIARSTLHHNTALEKFTDFSMELDEMNKKRMRILDKMLDTIETLNKELTNNEDLDLEQKTIKHIRLYPQIVAVLSEFNRTLQSYMDSQDKIVKTKEGMVWNEAQMLNYINQYLKTLDKNGQIKIIDQALK
jgi:hypothetical protein